MSDQLPADIPDLPLLPEGLDPLVVTKALAAACHPAIIKELAFRAGDNTVSTTSLLAISEHMYKVSGLSAKQEIKPQGNFVFNIHLGGNEITVSGESEPIDVENPSDFGGKSAILERFSGELGPVPPFMQGKTGNLVALANLEA